MLGITGCKEAAVPSAAPSVTAQTPEARFEAAMTRLQSMLAEAQAAASSGVVSERTCEYRLIPPKNEGDRYTAEVTIHTKVALANAPAAATLPKPTGEVEPAVEEDPAADGEEAVEEFVTTEDDKPSVEVEENPDNGVTRRAIAESMKQETNVYLLAYEDERWKLLTEPKGETEKLVFEYALGK